MKKSLREWMLEQDAGATPQLDAMRAQMLAPKQPLAEILLALFRPAGAWATLIVLWIALIVANHAVNRPTPGPRPFGISAASATLASLLPNDTPAPLDNHS